VGEGDPARSGSGPPRSATASRHATRAGRPKMGDPEAAFPGSLVLARCYGTTHAVGKAGVWCGVWVGTAAFGQHGTTRTYPTPAVPLPQIRRMAETAGAVLPWLRVPVHVAGWGPMSRDISIQGVDVN
jgi:hypothetical protein